ncbi:MAG: type II toxin-antitoxin system HicB family antitoxin [Planctomycetota bacterium]
MTTPEVSAEHERQAAEAADRYAILLERHDDGLFYGRGVEYPYLLGHGKTPAAAYKMAREGLIGSIAVDLASGEKIPEPMSEKRDQQINVRVSTFEKLRIERAAKQAGFRGIADYLRHAALAEA